MRKYYQALILSVAVISLVTLLFYKYQYEKIRYVLEVLDTFGEGKSAKACEDHAKSWYSRPRIPGWSRQWQEVGKSIVYSAFLEENHVVALALVPESERLDYDCFLWIDGASEPVPGQFAAKNLRNDVKNYYPKKLQGAALNHNLYMFICAQESMNEVLPGRTRTNKDAGKLRAAFGVSFTERNKFNEGLKGIMHVVNEEYEERGGTAICVIPPLSTPLVNGTQMIEFLAFHHLQGVKHFKVYASSTTPRVTQALLGATHAADIHVEILPTGYSSSLDLRFLYYFDCIHRHKNIVDNVLMLSPDTFVLSPLHPTISSLVMDYEKEQSDVSKLMFKTRTACRSQQSSNYISYAVLSPSTLDIEDATLLVLKNLKGGKSVSIPPHIAKGYKVSSCGLKLFQIDDSLKQHVENMEKHPFKTVWKRIR